MAKSILKQIGINTLIKLGILILIIIFFIPSCDSILFKLGLPNLGIGSIFSKKPFKIADTENTILSIKNIKQLYTYMYYNEGVFYTFKEIPEKIDAEIFENKLIKHNTTINNLLIQSYSKNENGKYYSFNSEHISSEDEAKLLRYINRLNFYNKYTKTEKSTYGLIMIYKGKVYAGFDFDDMKIQKMGNSININLPSPKILDVVIDPKDYEVYYKNKDYEHREMVEFQIIAKRQLSKLAIKFGLLNKAKQKGKRVLKKFFKLLGYNNVKIIIADDQN